MDTVKTLRTAIELLDVLTQYEHTRSEPGAWGATIEKCTYCDERENGDRWPLIEHKEDCPFRKAKEFVAENG